MREVLRRTRLKYADYGAVSIDGMPSRPHEHFRMSPLFRHISPPLDAALFHFYGIQLLLTISSLQRRAYVP